MLNGSCCCVASDETNSAIKSHLRLGHISQRELSELTRHGLLDKNVTCELRFFECCELSKQYRLGFSTGVHFVREF